MFSLHRHIALLYLKAVIARTRTTPSPKLYPLLNQQHHRPSSSFSLQYYSTSTSDKHPFAVSYLVDNCGFSPEAALKASKRFRLKTSQELDQILTFFKSWGFSDSQIHNTVIQKKKVLLTCPVDKIARPKFEFLQSKGASNPDIVLFVTKCPRILHASLENRIIPRYELFKRFLHSDEKTLACIINSPILVSDCNVAFNVKMLLENGVAESNIANLLRRNSVLLCSSDLWKTVEEIRELGFSPIKASFILALRAKKTLSKSKWEEKIHAYKSWGWSEETVLEAFRRQPSFMLASKDRINTFMSCWVNKFGWNSLEVVKSASLLGYSLPKRIIPRATVLQFLLSKGLRRKNAGLITPFVVSEELFLQKYVTSFKSEASQLLKLYEEKMNYVPQDNGETDEGVFRTETYEIATRASIISSIFYNVWEHIIWASFYKKLWDDVHGDMR